MPGEKMEIIGNLKQKGAHPLTSADHRNSSQAGPVENWRKGPCGSQCRGIRTAAGAPRRVSIRIGLHPSPDYFIPLFTAKVKKTELLFLRFLETSPNCAVVFLPPPSVRPGASSGLRPPLRSLAGNQGKRGKSDTLAGLGVCQSVKCVRGESPQRSAHTPFPRKKHPLDNEILTYALSLRLSTWTLDEFLRN